jgi:hypothetical protein
MKATKLNQLKIFVFIAMMLATPVLLAAKTPPSPAPVAVAQESVYEFPATPEGEYVVHDFVIRNQGDAVLNVLKVKTT